MATLFAPLFYVAWSSPSGVFEQLLWCTFLLWLLRALAFLRAHEPPNIKRAVTSFIAGIALLDALLIAMQGQTGVALVALVGFGLTLVLQQRIAGT